MLFVEYAKCTTCKKAKKWLEENGFEFEDRDIKGDRPRKEELKKWMGLKERLAGMTEEEQYELLASDGMLVKRPIIVSDRGILVGFKEAEWSEKLK